MKNLFFQKKGNDGEKNFLLLILSLILISSLINTLGLIKPDMDQIKNLHSILPEKRSESELIASSQISTDPCSNISNIQYPMETQNTNSKVESTSTFTLTGRYSAKGVDTDSNHLFNKIEMNIEVNSTTDFPGSVIFRLQWGFGWSITFPQLYFPISQGIGNITFEINPREYYSSINNSSIIFEYLSIRHYSFIEYQSFYTSRTFHYTEFDKPDAQLKGAYDIIEEDTDADGLINYLNIRVNLEILKPAIYSISMDLGGNGSNFESSRSVTDNFDAGNTTVDIRYSFGDLYSQKVNRSYVVKRVEIFGQFLTRLDFALNVNSSRLYYYSEFEPPKIFLTRVYSDHGLDKDADGLFSQLSIMIELSVTVHESYQISVLCRSRETDYYRKWGVLTLILFPGVHDVFMNFDIWQNSPDSWNTSFLIENVVIQDSNEQIIVDESNVYYTKMYQSTSFEPLVINLLDNFWDDGVDSDDDKVYNYLEITVELNITKKISDYTSFMKLSDSRLVEISSKVIFSLNIGIHRISFFFDANDILESFKIPGFDSTVFEVSLFRIYNSEMFLILEEESMYTTREYAFSSFEAIEPSQSTTITEKSTAITTSSPKDDTVNQIRMILLFIFIILLIDLYRERKNK